MKLVFAQSEGYYKGVNDLKYLFLPSVIFKIFGFNVQTIYYR